ncbi:hypothetical protein [Allohahella marinimesophila]|uniref:Uncharacterized protein n=1 Tax=Allohahella marinimesophila TaxID=1054972 RepID=A0ABP7NST1_9GAMM
MEHFKLDDVTTLFIGSNLDGDTTEAASRLAAFAKQATQSCQPSGTSEVASDTGLMPGVI